jgi:uncharacterized protein YcbX
MTCDSDFTVEQVWRFPVKSLGGQRVQAALVDGRGLRGDRLWAVRDADGKLGSGKHTRRFKRMEGLLGVSARYLSEPGSAGIEPPVVVGPDGRVYPVRSGSADEFLRALTGLPQVEVRRERDISHFDEVPLSVIGTATVAWLQAELPEIGIDPRRFRANLVITTSEPFAEESWLGRVVRIGSGKDAVEVVFDRVLQRCVMVGMRQPGLGESGAVLKRIAERDTNPLRLALGGLVTRPGGVMVGDRVQVGDLT